MILRERHARIADVAYNSARTRLGLCDTSPVTSKGFRRIALGMEGAVEGSHMGHADFRAANGKIFATLNEDETRGMASLTPDEQFEFMKRAPEVFVPAAGAWGRQGSTMIVLANADEEMVGEAVTLAWKRVGAGPAARPRSAPSKTARRTAASPPRRGRKRPS